MTDFFQFATDVASMCLFDPLLVTSAPDWDDDAVVLRLLNERRLFFVGLGCDGVYSVRRTDHVDAPRRNQVSGLVRCVSGRLLLGGGELLGDPSGGAELEVAPGLHRVTLGVPASLEGLDISVLAVAEDDGGALARLPALLPETLEVSDRTWREDRVRQALDFQRRVLPPTVAKAHLRGRRLKELKEVPGKGWLAYRLPGGDVYYRPQSATYALETEDDETRVFAELEHLADAVGSAGQHPIDARAARLRKPLLKLLVDVTVEAAGIVRIDASGNRLVSDETLVLLTPISELRSLCLNNTAITDAGLAHLAGLASLERLLLLGTRITDAGLVHLRGLSRLKHLALGETGVTQAGFDAVAVWFPELTGTPFGDPA